MNDRKIAKFRLVAAALGACWLTAAAADVVIVTAPPGQAYAKAGMQTGDTLTAWRLDDPDGGLTMQGRFDSVFDVYEVSIEQAPRGSVTVTFVRDGDALNTIMPPARTWVGQLRPAWAGTIEADVQQLLEAFENDPTDAAARQRAQMLAATMRTIDAAWFMHQAARTLRAAGDHTGAASLSSEALAFADRAGHPLAAVAMIRENAIQLFQTGNPDAGLALFEESLRRAQAANPDSLATALALNNLAIAHSNRSEFDAARERGGSGLEIRERAVPASLPVAESLHTLGNVAFWTDHLDEAAERFSTALAIRERHDPAGLPVARNLQVLANVEWRRGRLDEADALMQRAAGLFTTNHANDGYMAEMSVTLGHLAADRGRYRLAEERYLSALPLWESFAPNTKNHADALHALGVVALARADDETAQLYETRALSIYEPLQGDGQRVALVLTNLGRIALRLGNFDTAETHFERSLSIVREFADSGQFVATRTVDLGDLARARGDRETAERHYREARAILERAAQNSLSFAIVLTRLGTLLAATAPDVAETELEAALAIASEIGPGTLHEARPAFELAMLHREVDPHAAIVYFDQAITALESQRRLIGGPDDVNARFAARFEHYYKEYARFLADLDRAEAAALLIDRYRSQNLRLMLANRNLEPAPLPPALRAERERLNREYGVAYRNYRSLDGNLSSESVREALATLQEIRIAQRELAARAAGADGRRLQASAIAADVPTGSIALSFAVLENETLVFARTAAGTTLHRAPIGKQTLTEQIRRFRILTRAPDAGATLARNIGRARARTRCCVDCTCDCA